MSDWLTQAQARCDAASEGPWGADGATIRNRSGFVDVCCGESTPLKQDIVNATYIAHARTDLPHALELVRQLLDHNIVHDYTCDSSRDDKRKCSCGLDDLLEAVKKGPG